MKAAALPGLYDKLTAEERFALVLAAGARGDEAEGERLARSAPRVTISAGHHFPYAMAFREVAEYVLLELLDTASVFVNALLVAQHADAGGAGGGKSRGSGGGARRPPGPEVPWDMLLFVGRQLKVRARGWELFCTRRRLPPFLLWDVMPGGARLRHALGLAEGASLSDEAAALWLDATRPAGQPGGAKPPTAEQGAAELDELFAERVQFWSA